MCRMWLLVVAVVGAATGTASQCWDRPQCQDLSTESNMLECLQLCHSDLSAETPILPGEAHLLVLPLSPSDLDSSSLDLAPDSHGSSPGAYKRSYSMEHFRWGKPVGRKRRPVKVPVEEVLSGSEVMRRQLEPGNEVTEEEEEEQQQEQQEQEEKHNRQGAGLQEKKDGAYRMSHFRWSGPPASKRYGGFMKSWDERSQKPLLTLFKNIINKDGQQQRRDA